MAVMVIQAGVPSTRNIRFVAPATLVATGVAAASALGALLGAVGAAFDPVVLRVLLSAGVLAILAGVIASSRPWQMDHETPSSWLQYHDWRTVALNGITLGTGFSTRLGFWAWYVLPLGALALRDPVLGASIFATNAFARLALSAALAFRTAPGSLTARQPQLARMLDPATTLVLCSLVASTWVDATPT